MAVADEASAQSGVVRGRVVRADQDTGVPDVEVLVRGTTLLARSDRLGRFAIEQVPAGRVELRIRRLGFTPVTVALTLEPDGVVEVEGVLTPAVTMLDPIVTSATLDPRSLASIPAGVSVADTSNIGRDRTVALSETLRMMPGVQVASRSGTEDVNIGIRGSSMRTRQGVRGLAVLLDGIPITESDGAARVDLIELAAARQVEVVRGPASALYSGSSGGVVNVVSRSGADSRGVVGRTQLGSYGFGKLDVSVGDATADGRGRALAAGSYTSATGYRAQSASSMSRAQLRTELRVAPRTVVAIEANGSWGESDIPGALTQGETDADPFAASPVAVTWGFSREDDRWRAGTRVEQGFSGATGGSLLGYVFYGGRTLDFPFVQQVVDLNLHRTQAGVRAGSIRAGQTLSLAAGFDYDILYGTDRRWQNARGGERDTLRDDGYFAVPNLGFYGQGEWQAGRDVKVTAGLRYDDVQYSFQSVKPGKIAAQDRQYEQLSPKVSLAWSPRGQGLLYASIGRGFEVPVINEISASPGSALRELEPKSLWNYEVGGRVLADGWLLVDGSLFYADIKGEFIPSTDEGLQIVSNAVRSRNLGLELGMRAGVTAWLDAGANYTFSDFTIREFEGPVRDSTGSLALVDFAGKRLPAIPQHRVTAEVQLRPVPRLSTGVQVEWQSLVYVDTGNQDAGTTYTPVAAVPFRAVPARLLMHLNARVTWGGFSAFASVENLFNTRYTANVVANDLQGRYYEAGPGRALAVGVGIAGWSRGF